METDKNIFKFVLVILALFILTGCNAKPVDESGSGFDLPDYIYLMPTEYI